MDTYTENNKKVYPFGEIEFFDPIEENSWDQIHDGMLPIMSLYHDPDVTDVFINRYDNIWKQVNGKYEKTPYTFSSEHALKSWVSQIAVVLKQPYSTSGNYVYGDKIEPVLDARLPDGSRLMCTDSIISPQGTTVSLRKVPNRVLEENDFINSGMMTPEMLEYLVDVIKKHKTFLVAGNTGSGKTSLLRFLAKFIDIMERIITAEDTQELHIHKYFPLGIALEAAHRKDVNADLPSLVNLTMRGNPDRVWVGEIRTAAAIAAFYMVLSSGTTGNASTLHSVTAAGALRKMAWLMSSYLSMDFNIAQNLITSEIDVIVQCRRTPQYGRRVTEIVEVRDGVLVPVFLFDEKTLQHKRVLFD
ncbi:ATPase, T2SS/T4P/T4SS family [Klebsiella aerogenes]